MLKKSRRKRASDGIFCVGMRLFYSSYSSVYFFFK